MDSFFVLPRSNLSPVARARADYTIRTLGFNKRDFLVRARRTTYRQLRRSLECYVQRRREQQFDVLAQIEHDIRTSPHPAVWFETRRQHRQIPELMLLFGQTSEALAWDWLPDAS